MTRLIIRERSASANHIKQVARQLFAERGVDGVTVRDIAEAAGQKNHAAVAYHFGSKEALVREMIVDGARLIDDRRNAMLDALEERSQPLTLKDLVETLVYPSVDFGEPQDVKGYNRFIFLLDMTHREFFLDVLEGRWNSGYLRAVEHIKRLMPDMPEMRRTQKLVFIGRYLGTVMAARERKLEDASRDHPVWQHETTLPHLVETMLAILEA